MWSEPWGIVLDRPADRALRTCPRRSIDSKNSPFPPPRGGPHTIFPSFLPTSQTEIFPGDSVCVCVCVFGGRMIGRMDVRTAVGGAAGCGPSSPTPPRGRSVHLPPISARTFVGQRLGLRRCTAVIAVQPPFPAPPLQARTRSRAVATRAATSARPRPAGAVQGFRVRV
jgi:hypothetical protein